MDHARLKLLLAASMYSFENTCSHSLTYTQIPKPWHERDGTVEVSSPNWNMQDSSTTSTRYGQMRFETYGTSTRS